MRGGGHRPAPGRHPVGQVRPQSCNGGQAGLLPLVLERVGGKGRHGGRVSRVPGADVASVHRSARLATPQAGQSSVLPARILSPAAYAPRQGVLESSENSLSLQAERALLIRTFAVAFPACKIKRPQRQIFGTTW